MLNVCKVKKNYFEESCNIQSNKLFNIVDNLYPDER